MHRFYQYLEAWSSAKLGPGTDLKARDKKLEELRRLWESSVPVDVPAPPDVDSAWQSVQFRISQAEAENHDVRSLHPWKFADLWPRQIVFAGGVALIICIALVLTPYLLSESYQTGNDAQLIVTLRDSSTVTLSENSSLSLKRNLFGKLTHTTLKGKGFFSVKPQDIPFIVTTSIGNVRVVGTQFDVRCDPTQLYVAVTHGTVAVSSSSGFHDSTVFVHRGEFVLCKQGGLPDSPRKSLTEGEPLWLKGTLTFTHANLQSVCDEISRQLGVRIVLNNRTLDTLKVTGMVRGSDTRQILSALCDLTGTNLRSENDGYVVY